MSTTGSFKFCPVDPHKPGQRRRLRDALRRINGHCLHCRQEVRWFAVAKGRASCSGCGGETFTLRAAPGPYTLPQGIEIVPC